MENTFKRIDLKKMLESMPKKRELKYKTTKRNFIIFIKSPNGKWVERYAIPKYRCSTTYQQFDWVLHMNGKVWIDGYKFAKEFSKAIQEWGYGD